MTSVRDSQKDLISETVSVGLGHSNNNEEKMFSPNNSRERKLLGALFVSILGEFLPINIIIFGGKFYYKFCLNFFLNSDLASGVI